MLDEGIPDGYPRRLTSTTPPTEFIDGGNASTTTALVSSITSMTGETAFNIAPAEVLTESLTENEGMETIEYTMKVQTVEDVVDGSKTALKISTGVSDVEVLKKREGVEPTGYCSNTIDI
jgi:hypothetical protein